jgi:hypothetical protein
VGGRVGFGVTESRVWLLAGDVAPRAVMSPPSSSLTMQEVLLVILGFVLGVLPTYWERRRRQKAHKAALDAEQKICRQLAQTYLDANIAAPLYRLPEAAFSTAFPALLADGVVSQVEIEELEWFWLRVQDINRGLDQVNAAIGDKERVDAERSRLVLKCRHLLDEKPDVDPTFV